MRRALALLGIAAAMGCAQEHADPCPGLAAALAADAMIHARTCARWAACYRDGDRELASPWCSAARDANRLCADLASGALVFHPERVDACAAALDACTSGPCFVHAPDPVPFTYCSLDACLTLFERGVGATCDWDCGDGNCVASGACGGTCQPRGAAGAPCGERLTCADGLHCDSSGQCTETCAADSDCPSAAYDGRYSVCADGHCVSRPRAAIGEPATRART